MLRVALLLVVITLTGCVPPKTLSQDRIAAIDKIGVITNVACDMVILDHTGTMDKSYTYGQFGALGALIEAGILSGVKEYRATKSINGNLEDVALYLTDYDLKQKLDFSLNEKITKKYSIVGSYSLGKVSSNNKNEILAESSKLGIDTLVVLDVAYGLAAYKDKPGSVSIDANMIVYEAKSGGVVLKTMIKSDKDFPEHRNVDEFKK